jgi:hypothetical protein
MTRGLRRHGHHGAIARPRRPSERREPPKAPGLLAAPREHHRERLGRIENPPTEQPVGPTPDRVVRRVDPGPAAPTNATPAILEALVTPVTLGVPVTLEIPVIPVTPVTLALHEVPVTHVTHVTHVALARSVANGRSDPTVAPVTPRLHAEEVQLEVPVPVRAAATRTRQHH